MLDPKAVQVGDVMEVKPGEKVALDGTLNTAAANFNTAALTGESAPQTKQPGEAVLAGMINLETLVQVTVTAAFQDTKLSKILAMVQDAVGRKAKTQQFITKFAKIYTPIVVGLAVLLIVVPYFVVDDYVFRDWLYRALVFLVISCPCALVISIPLGYFGGIGAASKAGILFKGSNFLDVLREIDTVVMDKTGTLTQGVFAVQQVQPAAGTTPEQLLRLVGALETKSTHPIAKAVVAARRGGRDGRARGKRGGNRRPRPARPGGRPRRAGGQHQAAHQIQRGLPGRSRPGGGQHRGGGRGRQVRRLPHRGRRAQRGRGPRRAGAESRRHHASSSCSPATRTASCSAWPRSWASPKPTAGCCPKTRPRYVQQYLDRGPQAGLRGRRRERCAPWWRWPTWALPWAGWARMPPSKRPTW